MWLPGLNDQFEVCLMTISDDLILILLQRDTIVTLTCVKPAFYSAASTGCSLKSGFVSLCGATPVFLLISC